MSVINKTAVLSKNLAISSLQKHDKNTLAAVRSRYLKKWAKALPAKELDYLLCFVLGLSRWQIYTQERAQVHRSCQRRLNELAERRAAGVPLAYLTGEKEFYSLVFKVTPATLTPRPETEMLVDFAVRNAPRAAKLLELGCGCGAVAIAIARHRPDLHISACDVSAEALRVAAGNVRKYGSRMRLLRSDWFSRFPRRKTFHCIVANAPYLSANEALSGDIAIRHEPKLALIAKQNGLAALQKIALQSPFHLRNGGLIALEHAHWQKQAVAKMVAAAGFRNVSCVRDCAGLFRLTVAKIGAARVWRHRHSSV